MQELILERLPQTSGDGPDRTARPEHYLPMPPRLAFLTRKWPRPWKKSESPRAAGKEKRFVGKDCRERIARLAGVGLLPARAPAARARSEPVLEHAGLAHALA